MDKLNNSKENAYDFMITDNPVIDFGGVWHEAITIFASNFMRKLCESNSKLITKKRD